MRFTRELCAVVATLVLAVPGGAAEPPSPGTFSGEGLTLTLKRDGTSYSGTATLGQSTFDLTGALGAGDRVSGSFTSGGSSFTWVAALDGQVLVFSTGGTEYRLARVQSDNPLAKKTPANPLAAKPAPEAGVPGGQLRFERVSVKDPGINNIEAVSFLIPRGWKAEGGVKWFPDYSILANLLMTITDPQTGAKIEFLPIQNFSWLDNPVVPMQNGTNYMGNIIHPPVLDGAQFVKVLLAPQAAPRLAEARLDNIEPLPKVAEQISAAWGGQARVTATRLRYEYEDAGTPWEEDVYVVLVASGGQGMTIWSDNMAYSFRAPRGKLDELTARMAVSVNTMRLSPDWYGGYMYVQQLFMNRMNQGIRNAAAISATVTQNSEEIRRMFSDSYKERCASQDRISQGFSEYIRGVETYRNPFEDRPIQLPSGYNDVWVNPGGEYILSSQAGFDPNVGATTEWRRMEHAK